MFSDAEPTGKMLDISRYIDGILDNTREHDEMVRNFVEKLCDAQLNLQLALEDDVDFLSSSAMPSIMTPLNASTMYHDKSRLPQILTDKAESLQRDVGVFPLVPDEDREDAGGDDDDDGSAPSQPSHELSNVMEEDESKRASSYLLARKRSSAQTRRTSVAHQQPQNADNDESTTTAAGAAAVRKSRNSRRESMR